MYMHTSEFQSTFEDDRKFKKTITQVTVVLQTAENYTSKNISLDVREGKGNVC